MIAWVPPRPVRERLAVGGGEAPDDLHLTLCFFPDFAALDVAQVAAAMEQVSLSFGPLAGTVNGLGRFSIEDGDALVTLVDVPRLSTLREALVYELRLRGVEYAGDHGFMPHITLQCLGPGQHRVPLDRIEPFPITITTLSLFGPDGQVGEIWLGGAEALKAQGIPEGSYDTPPPAGPFADEWMEAEAEYATMLTKAMAGLWKRVRAELRNDLTLAAQKDVGALESAELWQQLYEAQVQQLVQQGALSLLTSGAEQAAMLGLPVDFDLVHQAALDMSKTYTDAWWQQFSRTTQRQMRQEISAHIASGAPLRDLEQRLAPLFGPARAKLIASTEVTRLYAEGNRAAYASSGVIETVEWRTANDERVEGQCAALLGQRYLLGEEEFTPPKHPACRCLTDNQLHIYTAKGPVRLKDIKVGDLVLTHRGRFRPVTALLKNEGDARRKVKIHASVRRWGFKVPCTEDHPFYTPQGWRLARELKVGDSIYVGAHRCQSCETLTPLHRAYCDDCGGKARARALWDNPKARAQAVAAISSDNIRSYQDGRRNGKEQTAAARRAAIEKYGSLGAQFRDPAVRVRAHRALSQNPKTTTHIERRLRWLLDENAIQVGLNRAGRARHVYPDVLLPSQRLVLEEDGKVWHDPLRDSKRDAELLSVGYRTVRFTEDEIHRDLAGVSATIDRVLANDRHEYGCVEAIITEVQETHTKARSSKVTYNLEVAEDHSYMAAGVVVHNCWLAPVVCLPPAAKALGEKQEGCEPQLKRVEPSINLGTDTKDVVEAFSKLPPEMQNALRSRVSLVTNVPEADVLHEVGKAAGYFRSETRTIFLDPNARDAVGNAVHELSHAFAVSNSNHPAVQAIRARWDVVRSEIIHAGPGGAVSEYAGTSFDEYLAENLRSYFTRPALLEWADKKLLQDFRNIWPGFEDVMTRRVG